MQDASQEGVYGIAGLADVETKGGGVVGDGKINAAGKIEGKLE